MLRLILSLLLVSANSYAETILIGTSQLDYLEASTKINSQAGIPYADLMISKQRALSARYDILQKATELRMSELNGETEEIYNICSEAFKIRHKADWNKNERSFFHRCFIHLMHLSSDSRKKYSMKIESKAFSETEELSSLSIPKHIRENFKWILINGMGHPTDSGFIKVPESSFRISYFSNQYKHSSAVITAEEFAQFKPNQSPLLAGTCEDSFTFEGTNLNAREVQNILAIDTNCQKSLKTSHHPIEVTYKKKRKAEFTIPNWAWWLAGGIVGYSVYRNNKKTSGGPQSPTSRRGF